MTKQVKNISGQVLAIPSIGVVEADQTITVPDGFNNANFETIVVPKPSEPSQTKVKAKPADQETI